MTATAHSYTVPELRSGREALRRTGLGQRFWIRASEDGWSLLGPDGEVVFRGLGLSSRRECLEYARELGVLAVIS